MTKKLSIIVVLILTLWLGGFILFTNTINSYRIDESTPTQAIIALTGGRNRISEAVRLLNGGLSERLFISGVGKKISLTEISRTQHLHIAPDSEITLGPRATDTAGNAAETADWLRSNRINSIRLVTSNYHIPRSLAEFRAQNPELKIIVHPVYSERVDKKWWTSWHTFSLLFAEYNKFLYVYVLSHLQLRGV